MNKTRLRFGNVLIKDVAIDGEPIFCGDCIFYSTEYIPTCDCRVHFCNHPNVSKRIFDIITGDDLTTTRISAFTCRANKDTCGPDATWFKSKKEHK